MQKISLSVNKKKLYDIVVRNMDKSSVGRYNLKTIEEAVGSVFNFILNAGGNIQLTIQDKRYYIKPLEKVFYFSKSEFIALMSNLIRNKPNFLWKENHTAYVISDKYSEDCEKYAIDYFYWYSFEYGKILSSDFLERHLEAYTLVKPKGKSFLDTKRQVDNFFNT